MSKRTKCQICKRELGTQVEPGEFCYVKVLVEADVAQLCKECLSMIPTKTIIDLRKRPKFFAENAIKKRRYKYKLYDMEKVKFEDKKKVFRLNVPGVVGTS